MKAFFIYILFIILVVFDYEFYVHAHYKDLTMFYTNSHKNIFTIESNYIINLVSKHLDWKSLQITSLKKTCKSLFVFSWNNLLPIFKIPTKTRLN